MHRLDTKMQIANQLGDYGLMSGEVGWTNTAIGNANNSWKTSQRKKEDERYELSTVKKAEKTATLAGEDYREARENEFSDITGTGFGGMDALYSLQQWNPLPNWLNPQSYEGFNRMVGYDDESAKRTAYEAEMMPNLWHDVRDAYPGSTAYEAYEKNIYDKFNVAPDEKKIFDEGLGSLVSPEALIAASGVRDKLSGGSTSGRYMDQATINQAITPDAPQTTQPNLTDWLTLMGNQPYGYGGQ